MAPSRTFRRAAIPLLLLACSVATEARRFRFFGIPSFRRETIEQVYDLPDRAPYFRDGEYYDLGYLHGFSKQGFVLYHGDSYSELDEGRLALIKLELGLDPVAGWKSGTAARTVDAHSKEREAQGLQISRKSGESAVEWEARKNAFVAAARRSGAPAGDAEASTARGTAGTAFVGFGIVAFVLFLFGGWWLQSKLRGLGRAARKWSSDEETSDDAGFEARLAQRLAELDGDGPRAEATANEARPVPQSPPVSPSARGFGRKLA